MAIGSLWARIRTSLGAARLPSSERGARNTVGRWAHLGFYGFIWASWIPVVIAWKDYVFEPTLIKGFSMYPYFNAERNLTTRMDLVLNYKWQARRNLARGMIVTFWSPFNPETMVVKRVIGVEGDIIHTRPPYPAPTIRVPHGHIWVEGDGDVRDSLDSNTYGPISTDLVIGKVTHILWPFRRAGKVRWAVINLFGLSLALSLWRRTKSSSANVKDPSEYKKITERVRLVDELIIRNGEAIYYVSIDWEEPQKAEYNEWTAESQGR